MVFSEVKSFKWTQKSRTPLRDLHEVTLGSSSKPIAGFQRILTHVLFSKITNEIVLAGTTAPDQ